MIGSLAEKLLAMDISEIIIEKHLEELGLQLTHQVDSIPIDRICTSSSITIQSGGYLPFGLAPSDHRAT